MRDLKFIWDFRGVTALNTAKHHDIHIKEYLEMHKIPFMETGVTEISELHSIAFLVLSESYLLKIRDELKPHRAEVYQQRQ